MEWFENRATISVALPKPSNIVRKSFIFRLLYVSSLYKMARWAGWFGSLGKLNAWILGRKSQRILHNQFDKRQEEGKKALIPLKYILVSVFKPEAFYELTAAIIYKRPLSLCDLSVFFTSAYNAKAYSHRGQRPQKHKYLSMRKYLKNVKVRRQSSSDAIFLAKVYWYKDICDWFVGLPVLASLGSYATEGHAFGWGISVLFTLLVSLT